MKHKATINVPLLVAISVLLGLGVFLTNACRRIESTKHLIDLAIATGGRGEISRAFDESIYDRLASMEEAIPALKAYLTHHDWFVRIEAAEALYIAGDSSGYEVLNSILTLPDPLYDQGSDQRLRAAQILGEFREKRAADAIFTAFQRNRTDSVRLDPNYITPLVQLNVKEAAPLIHESAHGILNGGLAVTYGSLTFGGAQDLLEAALQQPNANDELLASAAWALYRINADEKHYQLLKEIALKDVTVDEQNTWNRSSSTEAFALMATLREPRVAGFMEECLKSTNNSLIRTCAALSLALVQEGESVALNSFLSETIEHNRLDLLSSELVMRLAVRSTDPAVHSAAEKLDAISSTKPWKYALKRKNWPVYSWADFLPVVP